MNSIKKRLLSVSMAVLMIVGLMPANALAEDGSAAAGAGQIGKYFEVDDTNGGLKEETPSLSEGATLQTYENGFVTVNKTITATDTENEFIIDLDVTTKGKIEKNDVSEDAAVVLVIDTSNSMDNGRLTQAKRAAQAFINSFVEEGAQRKIAIVKFSGDTGNFWGIGDVDGAKTVQKWTDASALAKTGYAQCAAISDLHCDGGTNIEAGLVLAKNLLSDSSLNGISNKNIVLLTDGQPTYGIDQTRANMSSTEEICPDGRHMIGGGSYTTHQIHTQVENYVKNTVAPAGIDAYAVYVGNERVDCTGYNCNVNTSGQAWLASAGFTAFAASDTDDLAEIFEKISSIIELQAKAWILEDPMGSNIKFVEFMSAAAEEGERVCVNDTITWNMGLAVPVVGGTDNEPIYSYQLSYKVRLDNLSKEFEAGKEYATNGVTDLSYMMVTNDNGSETFTNGHAYANIPSVKGLEGTLSFTKVGSFDEALPGATFTLTADENDTVSWPAVSDANGVVTFEGIPSGHVYTLEETAAPEGYTKADAVSVEVSFGEVIAEGLGENNTLINESAKTSITVEKIWNDADDQDGIRPESIKVQLLADGEAVGEAVTVTPDAQDQWTYTWPDLNVYYGGKAIVYTVEEVEVPEGYESSEENFVITNTHAPATTDKTVTKVWDDANDQDGIRPDSIQVQLYANGVAYGDAVTLAAAEGDSWTYTWSELPLNAQGEAVEYTVKEVAVPEGYTAAEAGMTITNSHAPATRDITVTKAWVDGNDQDGIRPDSILVQLYANGEKVGEPVSLSADNNWAYTYEGLAEKANGSDIEYTVEELDVPEKYTVTIDGFDITNTYDPEVVAISGTKTWDDADDQDGIRPESITVNLLANGEVIDSKVVTEADGWTYDFGELDKYADGIEIEYTVTEDAVEGYEAVVDGFDIKNVHIPEEPEESEPEESEPEESEPEESEPEESEPEESEPEESKPEEPKPETPDTGDHNNMGMYVVISAVCVIGLVVMLFMKKKAKSF